MLRKLRLYSLVLVTVAVSSSSAKEPAASKAETKALRQTMEKYEATFNQGDADGIASFWTARGEYMTASGERLVGRDAIKAAYAQLFAKRKGFRLDASPSRLGLVATNVAVEEGIARLTSPGEPSAEVKYEVVYVKEDGSWKLSRVHESYLANSSSHSEQLKELAWLVGQWKSGGPRPTVRAKCESINNGCFLVRSFSVRAEDGAELKGTQYIGWDASAGQIRSWSFDSEGGFEEAVWRRDGKRWVVEAAAVLPDGRKGSAERILTPVDNDSYTWKSVNRQADGHLLPSIDTTTIVRVLTKPSK